MRYSTWEVTSFQFPSSRIMSIHPGIHSLFPWKAQTRCFLLHRRRRFKSDQVTSLDIWLRHSLLQPFHFVTPRECCPFRAWENDFNSKSQIYTRWWWTTSNIIASFQWKQRTMNFVYLQAKFYDGLFSSSMEDSVEQLSLSRRKPVSHLFFVPLQLNGRFYFLFRRSFREILFSHLTKRLYRKTSLGISKQSRTSWLHSSYHS